MTEVTPVSCEPFKDTFESNIVTIVISAVGELNVDMVLRLAAETYNGMSQESYCDPMFRQITGINLIGTLADDASDEECTEYTIEVSFQGECRGCTDGDSILETSTQLSRKLEKEPKASAGSIAIRALEDSNPEQCFCTENAVADRAPSYQEFKQHLEENIRSVINTVCEVKEVWGEEASASPSAENGSSEPPTMLLDLSSNATTVLSSEPSQYCSKIPSDMPSTLPSSVPSTALSALQSSVSTTSTAPSMSHSSSPSASVYPSELPSSVPTSCIAESACNPQKACQRSENLCVGPDSCSGKNSCRATLNANIESNSCIGRSTVTLVTPHLHYQLSLTLVIFQSFRTIGLSKLDRNSRR